MRLRTRTENSGKRGRGVDPAVSVIMPSYNTAQYIRESLDSVFAQTFTDYEVIVVNDGSPDTDELERILEPYLDRIAYVKQENRGVSGARNTAIRRARGKYLANLDSDDLWEPEYLSDQVAALEHDPSVAVRYTNAYLFGELAHAKGTYMDVCPSEGEVDFERLITQRCNVLHSAAVARREAVIAAGMFDEALRTSEDFDLWLRIVKLGGRITYTRRPQARYRYRPGGFTRDPVWVCEHFVKVLDKAAGTLSLTASELDALGGQRAHYNAMSLLYEGKKDLRKGAVRAAMDKLKKANEHLRSRKVALTLILLRLSPRLLSSLYRIRQRILPGTHAES